MSCSAAYLVPGTSRELLYRPSKESSQSPSFSGAGGTAILDRGTNTRSGWLTLHSFAYRFSSKVSLKIAFMREKKIHEK
jgi:hypothetical protein